MTKVKRNKNSTTLGDGSIASIQNTWDRLYYKLRLKGMKRSPVLAIMTDPDPI